MAENVEKVVASKVMERVTQADRVYVIVSVGGPELAKLVDAAYPTRKAFADAAMISVSDASRFCSGKRKPPTAIIPQICAALGVSLPSIKIPDDSITKASARLIRSLENALSLERERAAMLEHQVAALAHENKDLRAKLTRIREMST